jgi:hypothetical protein
MRFTVPSYVNRRFCMYRVKYIGLSAHPSFEMATISMLLPRLSFGVYLIVSTDLEHEVIE